MRDKNGLDKEAPDPDTRRSRRNTVLVVEPNPDQQWKLARMLTLNGRRVIGTSSCDGALALLAEYPVKLMLLADELPRMKGRMLAEKLRKSYPGLKVVLMARGQNKSNEQDERDKRNGSDEEDSGVFEFSGKSLGIESLEELLSELDADAA